MNESGLNCIPCGKWTVYANYGVGLIEYRILAPTEVECVLGCVLGCVCGKEEPAPPTFFRLTIRHFRFIYFLLQRLFGWWGGGGW